MKIYSVQLLEGAGPGGIILAANDIEEATSIASNELNGISDFTIYEIDISKPTIIYGDY